MQDVKKGDIIQIQRKSFYICDEKTDTSMVLIEIPDGKETTSKNKGPTSTANKGDVKQKKDKVKVKIIGNTLVEQK
jgi:hypothetical protein